MSLTPSRFRTILLPAPHAGDEAAPAADIPIPYPPVPPGLDCCHCGVAIEMRAWPPLEPVLSGPCPGCGGWISVDFRTQPPPPAENVPARDEDWELESPGRNEHRPALRMTRTGLYQPQFLPDLARAGLLPEPRGTDFEAQDTSPNRMWTSSHSDRWMKCLAIVVASAALIGGGFLLGRYSLSEPETAVAKSTAYKPLPPDHGTASVPLPDEMLAEARKTLAALATARAPHEVLPWILDPARIASQVDRYYHQGVKEPALDANQFAARPVSLRDRAQGIAVLWRMSENGKPLVVFLKKDPKEKNPRYRLDWETYIQEKEGLLPKFAADDTEREAIFRVVLRREHLFGDDDLRSGRMGVSLGTIHGLRLETPAVIEPRDALFARLDSQLSWNRPQLATVKLAWSRSGTGEKPRLTISQFFCWELAGVGGVPESPLAPALTLAGAR